VLVVGTGRAAEGLLSVVAGKREGQSNRRRGRMIVAGGPAGSRMMRVEIDAQASDRPTRVP
jgi:hypothetical protein